MERESVAGALPRRVGLPRARAYAIAYVAFDLLFLAGQDVRDWSLLERRRALRELVKPTRDVPHSSVSEPFEGWALPLPANLARDRAFQAEPTRKRLRAAPHFARVP